MASKYVAWSGIAAYVVVWLVVLPVVAEVSPRLAVLGLAVITAGYCFLMASWKHRHEALWIVLGGLAGFFELGLIPVVAISMLPSKYAAGENTDQESMKPAA